MWNSLSRRQALWLGGGLAATAGAVGGAWDLVSGFLGGGTSGAHPATALAQGAVAGEADQAYVHVIAHADDGLYFQNPDLQQAITTGRPTVTVCLTGGESDGINAPFAGRHAHGLKHDRPGFVRARMNGMRRAFALMATGDENSPWTVESVSFIPGFQVELNTLRAAPHVQAIWMQLVEARSIMAPNPLSLKSLWLGETDRLPTLPPTESPVRRIQQYTRDDISATLRAVLDTYRPTVVRTLDPNPDHALKQPQNWGGGRRFVPERLRLPVYLDHQDHQYSAYYTQEALGAHWSGAHARAGTVEHYLGYVNQWLPFNQDAPTTTRKQQVMSVYGGAGGGRCGDPAGCADLKVGNKGAHNYWSRSVRYRAPGSTSWLQPLPDRRLAAFALLNGAVAYWTETSPGSGRWTGPHQVAGGGLEGQVHVLRQPDGSLQLFSVRTALAHSSDGHRREVVTAVQQPGGGRPVFGPWTSLGCPNGGGIESMEMGYPVAVVDHSGAIRLFVRAYGGGIATRSSAGGSWSPWTTLPTIGQAKAHTGLMDGLGVAVGGDGRLHVLASGPRGVEHWASAGPQGALRPVPTTGLPVSAGPINAVALADGTVRAVYREPDTARVVSADLPPGGNAWRLSDVPGVGGFGLVAVGATGGQGSGAALAARDDQGLVAFGTGQSWAHGGIPLVHAPAVGTDAKGRLIVAALGPDGRLYTARQTSASATAPLGAWTTATGVNRLAS